MNDLKSLNRERIIFHLNLILMLFNSSWHFSLGLILLTVIYRDVRSNDVNEVGPARKNFFMDIQYFLDKILPPLTSPTTAPRKTTNITEKTTPASRKFKPAYYMRNNYMKNKKYGLQSDSTEDTQEVPGISEVDIMSNKNLRNMYFFLDRLGNLYNRTKKEKENQSTRSDDRGEENYGGNKIRQKTSGLKTLIIIVSKKKKALEEKIAGAGLSHYLNLSKSFNKDDFNQTILREAYGVACIKVAVRKCYKALLRVNDIVCRTQFSCKSSFKSTFLLKAKRGCITGFDFTGLSTEKPANKDNFVLPGEFEDARREKYIDACLPYMLPEQSYTVRKEKNLGNKLSQIVKKILRDESDKKCQKFSRDACIIACNYARDEVCSTYICGKEKKNAFTKQCKNSCRSSYVIKSDSGDSSSD